MTPPTQPTIQELREEFNCKDPNETWEPFGKAIDRLEAAEARIPELQQLMAQGHSKARKYELECGRLRRELYKAQRLAEGLSADFCSSPMSIQALPPVDDVSGLLAERLKRDAARIGELEAQLDAIAIALEWPPQEEGQTLLEAVKEAAMNGVLRCQDRAEMHRFKAAQQPRNMADAPTDGAEVLAWFRHRGWEVLSWSNVSD